MRLFRYPARLGLAAVSLAASSLSCDAILGDFKIGADGEDSGAVAQPVLDAAALDAAALLDGTVRTDGASSTDGAKPPGDAGGTDATAPPPGTDAGTGAPPIADAGPRCATTEIECAGKCVPVSDPKTCGSCSHDCTNLPHVSGSVTCQSGACVVPPAACAQGWAHCSGNADDGCEVDISKPANCGSCTNSCPAATPLCSQNGADAGAGGYTCKSQCAAPSPNLCGQSCVNESSDPLNCGSCSHACGPPASHGQAACASGVCGFACNATYTACGTDCIDLQNDPLHCGSCSAQACQIPANGQAVCTKGQCGVSCNSGTHLCSSVCVDSASVGNCGTSCTPCSAPANGTATCNGASCGVQCDPGYEPNGNTCVQLHYYIAVNGNDTNPGTSTSPFKTWKRAATAAASAPLPTFIHLDAGPLSATASGEDFSTNIPVDATVQGWDDTAVGAFDGASQAGLTFAGNGAMKNVNMTGFNSPIYAATGTQTLTNVNFDDIRGPFEISGTAFTSFTTFTLSATHTNSQSTFALFRVQGAHLTLTDGKVTPGWSNCLSSPPVAVGPESGGSLTASNVDFSNVQASGAGSTVTIDNSRIIHPCSPGQTSFALTIGDGSTATITNSTVTGGSAASGSGSLSFSGGSVKGVISTADTASLKMRSASACLVIINGASGIDQNIDLGTSSSAGNNNFQNCNGSTALDVSGDGFTIQAVGDIWVPNVQFAGANGRAVTAFDPNVQGANVSVSGSASVVVY